MNTQRKKDLKFIIDLGICAPFVYYVLGLLFQSQSCQNMFCYAKPDILQHSIVYDLVFLRGGYHFWNGHWFPSLLIPVLFFVILAITRNTGYALISAVFYGVYHEFFWALFNVTVTVETPQNTLGSIWLFILYGILIVMSFAFCKKLYFTKRFFILSSGFWIYLIIWYLMGYHVSLYGMIPTEYYSNFWVNLQEIGSWFELFPIFCINAYIFVKQINLRR